MVFKQLQNEAQQHQVTWQGVTSVLQRHTFQRGQSEETMWGDNIFLI